jgi:hypothetical protein
MYSTDQRRFRTEPDIHREIWIHSQDHPANMIVLGSCSFPCSTAPCALIACVHLEEIPCIKSPSASKYLMPRAGLRSCCRPCPQLCARLLISIHFQLLGRFKCDLTPPRSAPSALLDVNIILALGRPAQLPNMCPNVPERTHMKASSLSQLFVRENHHHNANGLETQGRIRLLNVQD